MANKLTNLTVEKVALVDEGDNPEANILIFKGKPKTADNAEPTKPDEDGITDGITKRIAKALSKAFGSMADGAEDDEPDEQTKPKEKPTDEPEGKSEDNPENEPGDKPEDKPDSGKREKAKKKKKGDLTDMSKIDTTKLTAEEIEQLEKIKKKALIEDDEEKPDEGVKKNTEPEKDEPKDDDIYKGIHPAVKAELEALKKFRADAEDKELTAIAKKYEVIGKKPDELVQTFKSLKKAGGTAYDDMISILDATVATVTEAGVFDEIGKRGGGATLNKSEKAWAQLESHAKDIRKAKPELTWAQALDEATVQHPELVHEYEDNM